MDISKINPYIRLSTPSILNKNSKINTRVIFDYELIYVEKGKFIFTYNDEQFLAKTNDFIFIRPGIEHSFKVLDEDVSQPHIHFDLSHRPNSEEIPISFKSIENMNDYELSLISEDFFDNYNYYPFLKINDIDNFKEIFYDIILSNNDNCYIYKKGLLIQLLSIIINDNFSQLLCTRQNSFSLVNQIKDYIDSEQGLTMNLDEFEKQFFYNKFYLEKQFKLKYNCGIIEYRNKKRMEVAKKLLNTKTVTETAQILGYSSIYSFSRAFKLFYGYSPKNKKHFN